MIGLIAQQPMRVLTHIHTLNDAAVIDQALDALKRQTRPPDAIIVVDNASTDTTLNRLFPANTTIVRNSENLGTSGAIRIGLAHALKHGFDWTWLFDADSVPEPDALENLLDFFSRLPVSDQSRVCFLACRPETASGVPRERPMIFTELGVEYPMPDIDAGCCRCDYFIWTGSLFRMPAVAKIGLPSADYVLDVAELEYGYRARQLDFVSYMVNNGVLHQDVGREPGAATRISRVGPFKFFQYEISPIRTYYFVRNVIYFWLYQCRPFRPHRFVRVVALVFVVVMSFAIRPVSHIRHLIACLRGIFDGLTMRMKRRY
jgi:rhamnopyranosyl-N-acetylglucosaminyl-diphospho-decaprenol beta-1,3/1,4-galactofuranosyltransferase